MTIEIGKGQIGVETSCAKLTVTTDDDGDGARAILLWVPNIKEPEHDHIILTPNGARALGEWLIDWWCQWVAEKEKAS